MYEVPKHHRGDRLPRGRGLMRQAAWIVGVLGLMSVAHADPLLTTPVVDIASTQIARCELVNVDKKYVEAEVKLYQGNILHSDISCHEMETGSVCGPQA